MELNATKEYSDIIKVLESLDEKIDTEIEKFREDFTQKYSLEITRDILQYATDFLKMKFHLLLKDTIKDFSWFNVIIDCTAINLNMNEIEAILSQVQLKMKDSIPKESEDFQIILKKYLRKVICKFPTKWTEPVVQKFLKKVAETLTQLGIVID